MTGVDNLTGLPLDGVSHIHQSVRDILTTPLNSRVMLREYGSELFRLTDKPMNASTKLRFIKAVVVALDKWEPRIKVKKVSFVGMTDEGQMQFDLDVVLVQNGQPLKLEGIVV